LYEGFVSLVVKNRGIDAEAVRNTEARCYDADDAQALGLIDAIHSPSEALAAFRQELEGSDTTVNTGVTHMSNTNPAAAGDNANTVVAPAAAAASPIEPAAPAVVAPAASAEAPVDQKARIEAITMSAEAKGREALAAHLAFKTDMPADAALAALAAAPAASATPAAAATTPFAAAMDGTLNPNVGVTGSGDGDGQPDDKPVGVQLAEAWSGLTGNKLREPAKS
jgi:ClpP class serine protease